MDRLKCAVAQIVEIGKEGQGAIKGDPLDRLQPFPVDAQLRTDMHEEAVTGQWPEVFGVVGQLPVDRTRDPACVGVEEGKRLFITGGGVMLILVRWKPVVS